MQILQIVGGQTWPNFLPLLAFKPRKVWFLTSKDPQGRFRKAVESMMEAANDLGCSIGWETTATEAAEPLLSDCVTTLAKLEGIPFDIVNLTGGTKAMSHAAWEFARDRAIPSFHLDTRRTPNPLDDFGTAPLSHAFPDIADLASQINVRTALRAQGFPVPKTFKEPHSQHLHFGAKAAQIRHTPAADKEIATQISKLRETFIPGSNFLRKGKLRSALQKTITTEPGSPFHSYLEAAAQHNIIEQLDPSNEFMLVRCDPSTTNTDQLTNEAENNFKLLEGIWFELAVLHHLRGDPNFADIQWSIEADATETDNASSRGETDLVAFDNQLNLHFLSCKTTGPHNTPLDHIQGLRTRATKEGGKFSKAELWIFRPKSDKHRQDLSNHCKEQGVHLQVFTDREAVFQ